MSSQPGTPEQNLRALAKSVANQLRGRGTAPQVVTSTTEREEEQAAGFLGIKKKKVKVADTQSISLGWPLWSQMMDDALYLSFSKPVNQVSNELQLWLREDGELVTLQLYRDHIIIPNRHVENITIRDATDDELRHADYEWHEVEEPGYPNPSVQYKRFWTHGGESPSGVPCAELQSRLLALVGAMA